MGRDADGDCDETSNDWDEVVCVGQWVGMIWVEMETKNVGDMHSVSLFGSTSESSSCWIALFNICAVCGWL